MMGRYAAIFGLILMMDAALSGDNEVLTSLALLLVLLASFIITQLFYMIDLLKESRIFKVTCESFY
ncbi:hypothetical protein FZC78_10115 [Rossellomorea vietnamensis]|uniref:Uncharacterized protein n=1 Tax=Rossellomorea vietnamensis TaxID=218284 RepID=A0A5D4NS24_9BACI|nr:hypothetical protein [Rossellomorea vietnamensis]TYS16977.1 hypothetical protein FZC78_10115 [Rossellomorea vietnamensis]